MCFVLSVKIALPKQLLKPVISFRCAITIDPQVDTTPVIKGVQNIRQREAINEVTKDKLVKAVML